MNGSQFLEPTIVPPPPPLPIRTSFESYRLILPSGADSLNKAGMIWLRPEKQAGGGIGSVPEYITSAVVYPITFYAQKDAKGNGLFSTIWRVHPTGCADHHDVCLPDSVMYSMLAVVKFASSGVVITEKRHFSKFAGFLRLQHGHARETMEAMNITGDNGRQQQLFGPT